MKVVTQGNSRNDRIIICIPIEKYQTGNISVQTLFPYNLSTGAVSTNSTMPTDNADLSVVYFRTFFVQVIGTDVFGRAILGGASIFCGESDIHMPNVGYTEWITSGTSPGYLGMPSTPSPTAVAYMGAGSPAFATHIALIFDT